MRGAASAHSRSLPPTLCLRLSAACPPAASLPSDYCLFIQTQNPRLEGCTIFAENEETRIHHVSPPAPRAHRGGNCGSNGYHNSVLNHRRTDTTVLAPTQSVRFSSSVSASKSKPRNRFTTAAINSSLDVHQNSGMFKASHVSTVLLD